MLPRQYGAKLYLAVLRDRFTAQELDQITTEAERLARAWGASTLNRVHLAVALQTLFRGR